MFHEIFMPVFHARKTIWASGLVKSQRTDPCMFVQYFSVAMTFSMAWANSNVSRIWALLSINWALFSLQSWRRSQGYTQMDRPVHPWELPKKVNPTFSSFICTFPREGTLLVLYIGLGARQLAEIQDSVITRLALGIVGKSDFVSGILILESIFPNFSEYFS